MLAATMLYSYKMLAVDYQLASIARPLLLLTLILWF